jgi:biotin synthase
MSDYSIEKIVSWLKSEGRELAALYDKADKVRKDNMGDDIFLRGIIEFSNFCSKSCGYCGIGCGCDGVHRYRIPDDEILEACEKMLGYGQTTVVLQSGEDSYYTKERMGDLIEKIKSKMTLAVTVSVGERSESTYRYWKEKGMDRYLLRFETSNRDLFEKSHPKDDFDDRINCLKILQKIGVQVGSGFLIGIPGSTYESLAEDILFCTNLGLDMIGVGPFVPSPKTEFKSEKNPFDSEVFFKVIAILRLLNPKVHLPATTAFDAIHSNGRNLLLKRGCNVFMPNATPQKYRGDYLLYPGKPCVDESGDDCARCVASRILSIGRNVGVGPGHSRL